MDQKTGPGIVDPAPKLPQSSSLDQRVSLCQDFLFSHPLPVGVAGFDQIAKLLFDRIVQLPNLARTHQFFTTFCAFDSTVKNQWLPGN